MATAVVVDDLLARFKFNARIGIAFVYCNFRRHEDQRPPDLLASILKQLCRRLPSVPGCVRDLFEKFENRRRPSLEELCEATKQVASQFSRVFLAIDALDECGLHADTTGVGIFATSRHIHGIKKTFASSSCLEISASPRDIRRYLDDRTAHVASFVADSPALQQEIKTAIVDAVQGMFLLAKLHLDSLRGQRSPRSLRLALSRLRRGTEAYSYAYEDAMARIRGQPKAQEELATQALAWIVCSRRPLTPVELREALAIEMGVDRLDPDNRSRVEDITSACAGLVAVDEEDNVVRLVHYTAQEYFTSTMNKWFPRAEHEIAQACVVYLAFPVFGACIDSMDKLFAWRASNPQHHLFDYAACNWGHHARLSAHGSEMQSVIGFLEKPQHVVTAFLQWVDRTHWDTIDYDLDEYNYSWYHDADERPLTAHAIHFAAVFGLDWAVSYLLQQGTDPNKTDGACRTPLLWATILGWSSVAALLLEAGAHAQHECSGNETALWWAARRGDEALVRLLLAGDVDVTAPAYAWTDNGLRAWFTPLSIAAACGHESVVGTLLDDDRVDLGHDLVRLRNAELAPNDTDFHVEPLYAAAWEGRADMVAFLLARGALPECDNGLGMTPLLAASQVGHVDVATLLLGRVDLNRADDFGLTPLARASRCQHEAIIALLLAAGADPNALCKWGLTILSHAAFGGSRTVVDLLLGSDRLRRSLDCRDGWGGSAVFWATVSGHDAVVESLVAHGARGRPGEGWDLTPLHNAATGLLRHLVRDMIPPLSVNLLLWDINGRDSKPDMETLSTYLEKFPSWAYCGFLQGTWDPTEGRRIVGG